VIDFRGMLVTSARRKIVSLVAAIVLSAALPSRSVAQPQSQRKPNVVFILVDNLGWGELGVYGGGILRGAPTPRIDKLAGEGLRLLNYNVDTECVPTRASLMTGRHAIRTGTLKSPVQGQPNGLVRWELTIADLLSAQGYATALYGKWHLGDQEGRLPNDRGFDEWYGIPRTTNEVLFRNSLGYDPKITPPQFILTGKKGEKSRQGEEYDLNARRRIVRVRVGDVPAMCDLDCFLGLRLPATTGAVRGRPSGASSCRTRRKTSSWSRPGKKLGSIQGPVFVAMSQCRQNRSLRVHAPSRTQEMGSALRECTWLSRCSCARSLILRY